MGRSVQMNSGADVVVGILREAGVERLFGIPSIHNIRLYEALRGTPAIRHTLCRHETTATHMADGYARTGGRLGLVLASTGPGSGFAVPALQEAWGSSSPVLLITTNIPAAKIGQGRGALHELADQNRLFGSVTKSVYCVRSPEEVAPLTRRAIQTARSGRPGPVYLEVPTDLLNAPAPMGGTEEIERDPQEESAPPLDRALDRLEEAERPVLFLGVEALRAGIGQQVRRLAERLSAPVLTTPQAKGIIPEDHPLVFGNAVRKGVVRDMIQHADLALAIGTRLREVDVKRRGLVLPRLIHVDWDAQWLDRNFKTDLSLMGPIPKIVEGLLQGLGPPSAPGKGRGEVEKMRARLHEEVSKARKKRVELEYLEVIRQALPPSGIHVVDNTQLGYWAEYFYVSLCPGGLLGAKGSSTIGFAFAAAMGAKLACPETAVISTMGDGGFLYSAQELATCVRHHIGFPLIVVNDGAYGVIAYLQRTAFEKEYESRLTNPDFCKLAQAYGVPAVRVDSPGALGEALDRALNDGRMWLVELMADFPEPPFGLY